MPSPSRRRRAVYWVIMMVIPLVLLAAVEGVLRLAGVGDPPPLFERAQAVGVDGWITNSDVGERYFPPAMRRYMPRLAFQYFPARKAPETFRIFALGGSSTAGFPYHAHASFTGLLEAELQHLVPSRRVETVNCAMTAVNSHTAVDFIPEILEHEPDLVLVYLGHNEFYGAYGVGSISSLGGASWLVPVMRWLLDLRLTGVLRRTFKLGRASEDELPGENVMETMVSEREIPPGSPLRDTAAEVLERNLDHLVRRCRDRGVPVLLCEVASNLRTQPPFGSAHAADFTAVDAFDQELLRADRLAADGALDEALAALDAAAALDTTHAMLRFRRGQVLERLGRVDDARREYVAARELDTVPFRAPAAINRVIHAVGERQDVPVVPLASLLAESARDGIPGDEFFLEHLHYNLDGNARIAGILARRLDEQGWLAGPDDWRWERDLAPEGYVRLAAVTDLDREIGDLRVHMLRQRWPYRRTPGPTVPFVSSREEIVAETARGFVEKRYELNEAHNRLGRWYAEQGRLDEAFAEFRSSLRMFPLDPAPALAAGEILLRMGRPEPALSYLGRALDLHPGSERAMLLLARAQLDLGRVERAAALVDGVLQRNPGSPAARALRDSVSARSR